MNIIRNANEIYHLGTKKKVEYATVFDSQTGEVLEPIEKYKNITQNNRDTVFLDDYVFEIRKKDSMCIVHNHTNGTLYSQYDIDLLFSNNCLKDIYLAANGKLLRIAKIEDSGYNKIGEAVWIGLHDLVQKNKTADYIMADSTEVNFVEVVKIFDKYGIQLERW